MIIEIVPSDPRWVQTFNTEKDRLQEALGALAVQIEHIGSTSVPGLGAKPVVDIQTGVTCLQDFDEGQGIELLVAVGYEYQPQFEKLVPFRRLFTRDKDGVRLNNLHVVARDHGWFDRHLYFRDYLRAVPDARHRYEAVKRNLAEREWMQIPDYAQAKNDIIMELEEKAYRFFDLDKETRARLRGSRV